MKSLSRLELLGHAAVLLRSPSSLTAFYTGMYVQPPSWWFAHILLAWLLLCEDSERMRAGQLENFFPVCFKGKKDLLKAAFTEWCHLTPISHPVFFVPCLWQKETHRLLQLTCIESFPWDIFCVTPLSIWLETFRGIAFQFTHSQNH